MRTHLNLIPAVLLGAALPMALAHPPGDPQFTTDFDLASCKVFLPNGGNEYFSLHPGRFLRLEGEDEDEFVELEITVLGQIRPILFEVDGQWLTAVTRIVEEREWIDGELVEVSRNFFGRCSKTGDVYYFGEEVDIYEDGEIVSHDGAWLAGEDGALPGLIMPELFLLGARYFQEIAPDVALDRAEHVEMGFEYETEEGLTFQNCVRIEETTPLDPDEVSIKIYAPGVGLIYDDGVEIVEHHP